MKIHKGITVTLTHLNNLVKFFFPLQELDEIRKSGMKNFRNIQVEESNLLSWQGLIVPVSVTRCGRLCFHNVS